MQGTSTSRLTLNRRHLTCNTDPFRSRNLTSDVRSKFDREPNGMVKRTVVMRSVCGGVCVRYAGGVGTTCGNIFRDHRRSTFMHAIACDQKSLLHDQLRSRPTRQRVHRMRSNHFPLPERTGNPVQRRQRTLMSVIVKVRTPVTHPHTTTVLARPRRATTAMKARRTNVNRGSPIKYTTKLLTNFKESHRHVKLTRSIQRVKVRLGNFPYVAAVVTGNLTSPTRVVLVTRRTRRVTINPFRRRQFIHNNVIVTRIPFIRSLTISCTPLISNFTSTPHLTAVVKSRHTTYIRLKTHTNTVMQSRRSPPVFTNTRLSTITKQHTRGARPSFLSRVISIPKLKPYFTVVIQVRFRRVTNAHNRRTFVQISTLLRVSITHKLAVTYSITVLVRAM